MKILFVTGIFPPDHGGPASYVPLMATSLQDIGHTIEGVITLSDSLEHSDSNYSFPVYRILRGKNRFLRWLHTLFLIQKLANKVDVVYLNGLVMEGVLATKIFGNRPVVIKVVGDLIWERARNQQKTTLSIDSFQVGTLSIKWRFLRYLQGWYTAKADRVIVPSQYLADIVKGWGVSSSMVRVVYNSVPTPAVDDRIDEPVADIVTVARLVPWKGISELIEIVATRGWSLRVVGDGPLRQELEELAISRNAKVTFVGHVSKALVSTEIRRARLFVLNSSYEGLPHIVLEAKAAGVAVVATAAGGTPETIEDGLDGWLVPVGDSQILGDLVGRLLSDDKARHASVTAAQVSLTQKFGFVSLIHNTEAVLKEAST